MEPSLLTADDSYDEYDATLDADASLVDWAAVPLATEFVGLRAGSQPSTPENGISRRNSSPCTPDDYGDDDYDESFLVQLTQLETNGLSFAYCGISDRDMGLRAPIPVF